MDLDLGIIKLRCFSFREVVVDGGGGNSKQLGSMLSQLSVDGDGVDYKQLGLTLS